MFRKAISCGLPIAPDGVNENAGRMKPGSRQSKGQWYDLIKQTYCAVAWDDDIHVSVRYDPENKCNNPPAGADMVNDDGPIPEKFRRG